MLLGGQRHALVGQLGQAATNAEARVAGLNDIVDVAELCCLIRIGKSLGVFILLLSKELLDVSAFLFDFLSFLCRKG